MKCSICLSPVSNPIELKCHHSFCYKCIDRWMRQTCSTCDVNQIHNRCPICREIILQYHTQSRCQYLRSPLDTANHTNNRKTRSMTRCQRQHVFSKGLMIKVRQWKHLNEMKPPSANQDTQLLFYLDEIMNLIYQNTWFFDGNTDGAQEPPGDFASMMKLKLDAFEKEGYKEAAIWKYKLRSIMN